MNDCKLVKNERLFYEAAGLPAGFFAGCAGRLINKTDYTLDKKDIRSSEKRLMGEITGLPDERLLFLEQVHGDEVLAAGAPLSEDMVGDGLITNTANLCLIVRTADCVPALIADPENMAAAAVHSGWRGCRAGIAEKAVRKMSLMYGSRPEKLLALILPSIGPESYEVGREVAQHFPMQTVRRSGKLFVSLWDSVKASLTAAGLREENVLCSAVCNFLHNDEFFSHRRGDAGRNLSFILMR